MRALRQLSLLLLALVGCVGAPVKGYVPPNITLNSVGSFSATTSCTAGTCTGSAPTDTTTGMELAGVQGFRLIVCAPTGQTLGGAGTMQAYLCDAAKSICARNPALDVSVTATSQCQAFPDFTVTVMPRTDKTISFVANGVTVSSGTPLTTYLDPGGPK